MEKKPEKKDDLSIVNNVLKLATKLLKVSTESKLCTESKFCIITILCHKKTHKVSVMFVWLTILLLISVQLPLYLL